MSKLDDIQKIEFICEFLMQKSDNHFEIYQHPLFVAEKKHQTIHTLNKIKSKIPYYNQLVLENNKKAINWLKNNLLNMLENEEYNNIIMNRNYFIKNEKEINPDWVNSFKNLHDLTSFEMLDEIVEKILEYQEDNQIHKFLPQYINDLLNLVYKQNLLFNNIKKELSYSEEMVN